MKVAIIPARGGSKRISRKNIRDFHGKPIIAYAIKAALDSKLFDDVFVSTEDEEIATIARLMGVNVPVLRSAKNADDFATTSDVLIEVIDYYSQQGTPIQTACCLYPTTPLINSTDLINAFSLFNKAEFETVISSVVYSSPIQRSFVLKDSNEIELLHPELMNARSQDMEKSYHDAGAFYFFDVNAFIRNKSLWLGKIGAYELSELKVQDIDNEEDWKLAELKYLLNK